MSNLHSRVTDYPRDIKPALTRWVMPGWNGNDAANFAITANRIYYTPIFVPKTTSYDRIGAYVAVGDGAGGEVDIRMFVWNGGLPGALLHSFGVISTNALGAQEIVIAISLSRGYYWIAARGDNTPSMRGLDHNDMPLTPVSGFEETLAGTPGEMICLNCDSAYADPAPAPTAVSNIAAAFCYLREA